MVFASLFALALLPQAATVPKKAEGEKVTLARRLKVGERLSYIVKAAYTNEEKSGDVLTFVPSDQEVRYNFTLDTLREKGDGIVEAYYLRPTMTVTIGDTGESGPVSKVQKINQRVRLTLAPNNELLDIKDETPKPPKKPGGNASLRLNRQAEGVVLSVIGEYIGEISRLSFFIGPFDSSLDLAPRLPNEAVKPGDTWKRTVGYAPQKTKGDGAKMATQRLDYTFRYDGLMQSRGKKVQRVSANLNLKTDLAAFGRQLGASLGDSIINKCPVTLDATIEYDLDPVNFQTLRAVANSSNSYQIYLRDRPTPIQEGRARGTTTLSLLSRGPTPAGATTVKKGG
ncbi:MAG: hypothetical protein C4320_04470 [Armatimonadota bacterium]